MNHENIDVGFDMAVERESINFKLPKTLTAALRAKARQLDTTATDLVIQGLHHVLDLEADDFIHKLDHQHDIITRIEALSAYGTESGVETRLDQLSTQLNYLDSRIDRCVEKGVEKGVEDSSKQRLSLLEEKLEVVSQRLAQLEGAVAVLGSRQNTGFRRQAFNYHPQVRELQPYTGDNLAKRLGVDPKILAREQKSLSPKEFESWCRSKDPSSMAWRKELDGFYHPVK